jgi:hypothetical protein
VSAGIGSWSDQAPCALVVVTTGVPPLNEARAVELGTQLLELTVTLVPAVAGLGVTEGAPGLKPAAAGGAATSRAAAAATTSRIERVAPVRTWTPSQRRPSPAGCRP